jgi:hypothetical protein
MTDVAWHDYVMQQLHPSELQNDKPKVDGLRRLVKKLIGTIVSENTIISVAQQNFAAVTVMVLVKNPDERSIRMEASADAHLQNSQPPFCYYCLALAETRAAGRAFRKLLGLRGTICAEEDILSTTYLQTESTVTVDNNTCSEELLCCINILAQRANLNVFKFMESINIHNEKFTKERADVVHSACNEFANGTKSVPSSLLGFQSKWTQEIKK